MKKLMIVAIAIFFCKESNAQITSADTICLGQPVTFSGPAGSINYTWLADTVNFNQTPTPFVNAGVANLNASCHVTVNYDNGTWYSFITNTGNGKLTRLTFNGSPNGSFTENFVGTYGPPAGDGGMGLEVIKDFTTGNWYGFIVNDNTLYRLDFGTSLANSPTSTSFAFTSVLNYATQVSIAKIGTDWIGFVGNKNATIVRLDFGTSLTNSPTATSIPNVGVPTTTPYVYTPCYFALHQEGGNWYMLIANFYGQTMTRYNFGSNLQNNNPTGTYLGFFGITLWRPRTIMFFQDDSRLIAYVLDETTTNIAKLDFGSSILNTPSVTFVTISPAMANKAAMVPYFTDSSMYMAMVTNNQHLFRSKWMTLPTFDSTTYYNSSMSQSFATPGIKNVTLYTNMGGFMGTGGVFSKTVYVVPIDTSISMSGNTLTANDATGSYQWIDCANKQPVTGATSKTFTPIASGSYAVVITKNGCTDTSNCQAVTVNVNDATKMLTAVYPNPTTGNVQIRLDHSYSNVKLKIMSALGQLVSVKEYRNTQLINTSIDGATGLYYLHIMIDGKATTHAVITKQ